MLTSDEELRRVEIALNMTNSVRRGQPAVDAFYQSCLFAGLMTIHICCNLYMLTYMFSMSGDTGDLDALDNRVMDEEWMPFDGSGEGGLVFGDVAIDDFEEMQDVEGVPEVNRAQRLQPPGHAGQQLIQQRHRRHHQQQDQQNGPMFRNRIAELLDRIASDRSITVHENGHRFLGHEGHMAHTLNVGDGPQAPVEENPNQNERINDNFLDDIDLMFVR